MRSLLSILALPAALAAALVSCGDKDSTAEAEFSPAPKREQVAAEGQGLPGFFTPRLGETWTYEVHRDVPPDTVLNDDDQLRSTDLPGGGYRFKLERQRVCLGTQTPEGSETELTVLELSEDGIVSGQEFLDISTEGMIARGWKPAGNPDIKLQLLTPGVLLASPQMAGGQVWKSMGASPEQEFQFRVLERTTVKVPAGSYEAARLQMNSGSKSRSVRRTLWFAENVGIVREEIIYFNESKITLRESAELTSWTLPADEEEITEETPEVVEEHEEDEEESAMENSDDASMEEALFGLIDEDVPMILLEEISWLQEDQDGEPSDEESSDEEQQAQDEDDS